MFSYKKSWDAVLRITILSWYKNWSYINSCISDFVSNSYNQDVFIVGCTIRELCISRGEEEHCLFNMYELEEFIEFLST